jgi:hypothetical protein
LFTAYRSLSSIPTPTPAKYVSKTRITKASIYKDIIFKGVETITHRNKHTKISKQRYIDERLPEEYEKCLVVDDAIRFVSSKYKERSSANSNKDDKESNEHDYEEDQDQLEEEQEEETQETTINQVF